MSNLTLLSSMGTSEILEDVIFRIGDSLTILMLSSSVFVEKIVFGCFGDCFKVSFIVLFMGVDINRRLRGFSLEKGILSLLPNHFPQSKNSS